LTVVTYDEFGGAWDRVPPPGQGLITEGAHDEFGPGTRIPTLVVSNALPRSGLLHHLRFSIGDRDHHGEVRPRTRQLSGFQAGDALVGMDRVAAITRPERLASPRS